MAESEKSDGAPVETPEPQAKDEPKATPSIGLPVSMFVKGATTTWEHDKKVKKDFLEAERRRDLQEVERRFAAGAAGGKGAMYSHQMATEQEAGLPTGKVLLQFVNGKGEPEYEAGEPLQMLGDVTVPDNPAYDGELMLIIFCPECIKRLPAGEAILQIRQSNRGWYLDQRKAGEPIFWREILPNRSVRIEPYVSAGVIKDCEKFTCGRCAWRAAIDDNKIWTIR